MPVILDREAEEVWLDPAVDGRSLMGFLKPYTSELMEAYEVSTLVNSPRNDVVECLADLRSLKKDKIEFRWLPFII